MMTQHEQILDLKQKLANLRALEKDARLLADMVLNYGWHVPPSATEAAQRIIKATKPT